MKEIPFILIKILLNLTLLIICIFACSHPIQQTEKMNINTQVKQQCLQDEHQKTNCLLTEEKQKPIWIDNPPQNDNYLYGIGIAPIQSTVTNQIQAAKILAMREVSQQIKIFINSQYQEISKVVGANEFSSIESNTKIISQSLLRRVKIIDQWNDVKHCYVYILASVELIPD